MVAFRDPILQTLAMFREHFGGNLLREARIRQLLLHLRDLDDDLLQLLREPDRFAGDIYVALQRQIELAHLRFNR